MVCAEKAAAAGVLPAHSVACRNLARDGCKFIHCWWDFAETYAHGKKGQIDSSKQDSSSTSHTTLPWDYYNFVHSYITYRYKLTHTLSRL